MYTQCSKCETVFRLSAEALRAANGQVRCGRCGEVFNALARLAEGAGAFTSGESSYDMETRADAILQSAVVLAVDEAAPLRATEEEQYSEAGIEIARLQILDLDVGSDHPALDEALAAKNSLEHPDADSATPPAADDFASLEFTLPPGELDRIFIESKARPLSAIPFRVSTIERSPEGALAADAVSVEGLGMAPAAVTEPVPEPAPHPESLAARRAAAVSATAGDPAAPRADGLGATGARAATGGTAMPEAAAAPRPRSSNGAGGSGSSLSVPENIRLEMLAGFVKPRTPEIELPKASNRPPLSWLIAAMVGALLLLGQFIHSNREWLAGEGVLGSALRATYATLGSDLPAPPNFAAYQLRQWGVTGEPGANGTLRVRASVLNTAAQLQPFPLLRVTLANRFGARLGTRDFEPAEYAGKPLVRMMAPGERVDATMDLQDPGKNAEGFEIDICLRGVNQKIFCVSDPKLPAR